MYHYEFLLKTLDEAYANTVRSEKCIERNHFTSVNILMYIFYFFPLIHRNCRNQHISSLS